MIRFCVNIKQNISVMRLKLMPLELTQTNSRQHHHILAHYNYNSSLMSVYCLLFYYFFAI
jgi:hypothetical protein